MSYHWSMLHGKLNFRSGGASLEEKIVDEEKKKKKRTPSFIAEFPLRVTAADERELGIRMEAARHEYNASLGEALRIVDLMKASKEWQAARKLPGGSKEHKKAKHEAFDVVKKVFGFTQSVIQKFAEGCRDSCWIGDHMGSHDTQTISLRAFRAAEQYVFGKRGRPRFKGYRSLHSVEGKGDAVLRFRVVDGVPSILWAGLSLPLMLDPRDRDGWQAEALKCRTKYVRVLRRNLRGTVRWYGQLSQEGRPPQKAQHPVGVGVVGLDLGPSTIAVVGQDSASLETFCATLDVPEAKIRRLQRAMDRSRRGTNPEAYNADGTCKKGVRIKVRSRRYLNLCAEKANVERCLAAERKRAHGELANRVLSLGDIIKTEKLSYRSFQKNFGRSVQRRAPSMFVSMLKRKAASAGASTIEFKTRTTCLSQYDHISGTYKKIPLSQRYHEFPDGSRAQRDLYSAWLARYVQQDNLDASQLANDWVAAEPLLQQAASSFHQSARGHGLPIPHALQGRQSRSPATGESPACRGCGGVAARREPQIDKWLIPRTPRL